MTLADYEKQVQEIEAKTTLTEFEAACAEGTASNLRHALWASRESRDAAEALAARIDAAVEKKFWNAGAHALDKDAEASEKVRGS